MNVDQREAIAAGKFEMPLFECELRQRGVESPIIYVGSGLIRQKPDKSFLLNLFAQPISEMDRVTRMLHPGSFPAGEVIPDWGYYDFRGKDLSGDVWTSERLSVELSAGPGTFLSASLRSLKMTETFAISGNTQIIHAIVPGEFKLPWHLSTKSDTRTVTDRFEGGSKVANWKIRCLDESLDITFENNAGSIEQNFHRFLAGLAILCGKLAQPSFSEKYDGPDRTTTLQTIHRKSDDASLEPFIPMQMPFAALAHEFLGRFIAGIEGNLPEKFDHTQFVYGLWYRVALAATGPIENSAVVLSIAIESMLKGAFESDADKDYEFAEEVEHAKSLIQTTQFLPRARNRLEASLSNALVPSAKQLLQRLAEQGAINNGHIEAWVKLRNSSAHGRRLEGSDQELNKFLNQYARCQSLFYRLIFVIIGYHGQFIDFGALNLPLVTFSNSPEI